MIIRTKKKGKSTSRRISEHIEKPLSPMFAIKGDKPWISSTSSRSVLAGATVKDLNQTFDILRCLKNGENLWVCKTPSWPERAAKVNFLNKHAL